MYVKQKIDTPDMCFTLKFCYFMKFYFLFKNAGHSALNSFMAC